MSYYPDSVRYPDGPDYDPPTFTGRCARCHAFIKADPDLTPFGLEVWRECPGYGGLAPSVATEADVADYEARVERMNAIRAEKAEGWWDQVVEITAGIARDFRVHHSEPVWPCAKCGHLNDSEEVYQ